MADPENTGNTASTANTLLDFVMSLVKDTDAAAHYAANPAQAIADANLTGVTSADVDQLIPMVADSMSPIVPTGGFDAFGAGAGDNVWASGAATAAFDAFGDQLPEQVIDDPLSTLNHVVTSGDPSLIDTSSVLDSVDVPTVAGVDDVPAMLDDASFDDASFVDAVTDHDWAAEAGDQLRHLDGSALPDAPGLDDLL